MDLTLTPAPTDASRPAWMTRKPLSPTLLADPNPKPVFTLGRKENLEEGMQRMMYEQFTTALTELSGESDGDPTEAVHIARKSFKRVRAALKLFRPELPEDVYRRENIRFRHTGQRLSGARDSHVLLETIAGFEEEFMAKLNVSETPPGLKKLRKAFLAELETTKGHSVRESPEGEMALSDLSMAIRRLDEWSCQHNDPVALADSFARIYRKGKKALKVAKADPNDETFHELRKRSKGFWHACEILKKRAPLEIKEMILNTKHLAELVGDDHDLAVLTKKILLNTSCFADKKEQKRLLKFIAKRRKNLQRESLQAAKLVYHAKPSQMRALIADA